MEKKEVKARDAKMEKNLKGDYGFDCHYDNGVNHTSGDCML